MRACRVCVPLFTGALGTFAPRAVRQTIVVGPPGALTAAEVAGAGDDAADVAAAKATEAEAAAAEAAAAAAAEAEADADAKEA